MIVANDFVTPFVRRPGILVLIDDSDWELLDGPLTVLEHNSKVVFISTLHGMFSSSAVVAFGSWHLTRLSSVANRWVKKHFGKQMAQM